MNFRIKSFSILCATLPLFSLAFCVPGRKTVNNDIERKVVIGKAVHPDSTDAAEALVSLFDVRIINDHDSIFNTYSATTSRNGYFVLQGVPDGQYLLYIYDVSRGRCDLSLIRKKQTSLQLEGPVMLKSLVTLKGRVITAEKADNIKVIIPGFGASTQLDINGFYVLPDVPAGSYELAFVRRNSVDYLLLNIADEKPDTVFIRDFTLGYQTGALSSLYQPER